MAILLHIAMNRLQQMHFRLQKYDVGLPYQTGKQMQLAEPSSGAQLLDSEDFNFKFEIINIIETEPAKAEFQNLGRFNVEVLQNYSGKGWTAD